LRHLRDLWVILGLTLASVLALDAVSRHLLPAGPAEAAIDPETERPRKSRADAHAGSEWTAAYYRELERSEKVRWEPFTYWRRQPFHGRYINVDASGLRATWNAEPAAAERQIWIFGGSTTWGTGARDEHTVPSELSRLLHARGQVARVTNFGESGYVSTQEVVALLRWLQRGERPDLVIFYDGVNDVYAAVQEGAAGSSLNEINRRREFNATRDWTRLLGGAVQRLEGLQRLATLTARRRPPERPATLAGDVVACYEANTRAVRALAETHGFEALLFWQPTVFTKLHVTDFERRARDSRLVAHRDLQLEANRLVATSPTLGHEASFVDLSGVLDAVVEPLYIDFCHLSEDGNRRMAESMLPHVLAALERR
jgi:lysophospholipase L1-like esterase